MLFSLAPTLSQRASPRRGTHGTMAVARRRGPRRCPSHSSTSAAQARRRARICSEPCEGRRNTLAGATPRLLKSTNVGTPAAAPPHAQPSRAALFARARSGPTINAGRRWARFTDDDARPLALATVRTPLHSRVHMMGSWAPRCPRSRVQVFCTADDADFAWRGRRRSLRSPCAALHRMPHCLTTGVCPFIRPACGATTACGGRTTARGSGFMPRAVAAAHRACIAARQASARVAPPHYRPHARHSPLTLARALPLARARTTRALALARAGRTSPPVAGSTARRPQHERDERVHRLAAGPGTS